MRHKHLLLALVIVLLPPVLAGAATLDTLTATADCNAWSSTAKVAFTTTELSVLLVFSMQVADTSGVEIERYDLEQWLTIPADTLATYPFGANWLAPLDRPATMTVTAKIYDVHGDRLSLTEDTVAVALACPAVHVPPAEVCRHASRWWLRHKAQWPVTSLTLGGAAYNAAALERLLRSPHRGQVERRLAHQLAVTKLNLANGVADDIGGRVAAADAWLAIHPLAGDNRYRGPRTNDRIEGLRLIKDLCTWNHATCRDGGDLAGDDGEDVDKNGLGFDSGPASPEFTGDLADYAAFDKAFEETTSLGSLKAMYR